MSLSMRGMCKAFDSNAVLRDVDFSLIDGEIRALIGENGAGKTTLMNILGGVISADKGSVMIDGQPVRFESPRESLNAGVAFIHQELNLINDLAVYENLFIGRELRKGALPGNAGAKRQWGLLDDLAMCLEAEKVLESMGISLDPRAMVRDLDAAYKQVVEIARALLFKARVIIMDEPTTSLTEMEIARVFAMMRQVSGQGVSIVFISHKLGEVLDVCDTYTVLRDGRVVAQGRTEDADELSLARHMVGYDLRTERAASARVPGAVALRGMGLTLGRSFRNVSFSARYGEIVGFTGLLGDGRGELFEALFGGAKGLEGQIEISGRPERVTGTEKSRKLGIGYVPRNRKENGIVKGMTVRENIALATLSQRLRRGLIDISAERAVCDSQVKSLHIKAEGIDMPIGSLSGGNQQKVVLAKWLAAAPRIMILDNPTQGVDVGAKHEIYDIIGRLADEGVAVIVLSSEAQEIVRICDRVLVMYHGELRGTLAGSEMNEHNIMVLATGGDLSAGNMEAGDRTP